MRRSPPLHRCPRCAAHVGWRRIFLARPVVAWPCVSCGFPLRWIDPEPRTKLLLGLVFAALVVVALGWLAASDLSGRGRLAIAGALALALGTLFQLVLARVGPAG